MELWHQFKAQLGSIILIVLIAIGAWYLPKFKRVTPDPKYNDFTGFDTNASIGYDSTVSVRAFQKGDVVAYQARTEGVGAAAFAWVAGKPGDLISIANDKLFVNGVEFSQGRIPKFLGNRAEVAVPADHLFVVSSRNRFDSFANGPVPGALILGRVDQ